MIEITGPVKQARIETPEYENFGARGSEKSILPVYSINGLSAGMKSEGVVYDAEANIADKRKILIFI
jgi:hypothetical protein